MFFPKKLENTASTKCKIKNFCLGNINKLPISSRNQRNNKSHTISSFYREQKLLKKTIQV